MNLCLVISCHVGAGVEAEGRTSEKVVELQVSEEPLLLGMVQELVCP